MAMIAQRLEQAYPESVQGWSVNVMPLREFFIAEFRLGLLSLMTAVVFVLLIACSNVASLLLARAEGRRREIAVRAAIGAGRFRLLRQLLTESMLLGLAGGAAGVLLARAGIGPMLALIPELSLPIPGLDAVRLDWRAAAFTILVSLAASVLFGIAPLGQTWSPGLQDALKEGGRGGTPGTGRRRIRAMLIVLEIAIAAALSIGTGFIVKSFVGMARANPGFRPENAMTFRVALPTTRYARPEQQRAFYRQLAERIRSLPSVTGVGLTNYIPLGRTWGIVRFTMDNHPLPAGETPSASNQVVTPAYFQTMGIGLVSGRFFTEQDDENAPRAALVNESLARRFWPGEAAVGQRIHLEGETPDTPPLIVVGVLRDVYQRGLSRDPEPELYRCYYQAPTASMSVVVRTASDPLALGDAVRREVAALDPGQPVFGVETLNSIVKDSMFQMRLTAVLFTVFAALALVLAAVGTYGLSSYVVAQRTQEVGLRLAMGATPGAVLRMVLVRGFGLALAGVASGNVIAWTFTRAISGLLYGASPLDPAVYILVSVFLLAVAAAANLIPALRAARTDPIAALRHE
jgi:putative ABC transport system permease protein